MLLNPGYAIVLRHHTVRHTVNISSFTMTLDNLFESGNAQIKPLALCLTAGTSIKSSWFCALNSINPAKEPNGAEIDRDTLLDPTMVRSNIKDRLLAAGVQIRQRPSIRIAPLKSAGLPPNFLDSKAGAFKEWVDNIKRMNENLVLPDFDQAVSAWETPHEGKRFKIQRLFFKSDKGLETMRDLLHGSKVGLVEGLPQELFVIREKIYVSHIRLRESRSGTCF